MHARPEEKPTTLGELIHLFYEEYLALYGDPELAAVAAAASVNDLLTGRLQALASEFDAAA